MTMSNQEWQAEQRERDARWRADQEHARKLAEQSWYASWRRPDGRTESLIGYIAAGLGLLLLVIGLSAPDVTQAYSFSEPKLNTWKWPVIWSGAAFFNLGLVFWLVGRVVRAMFFLPGRDIAE